MSDCVWFGIDEGGEIRTMEYAWPDPHDRAKGDGEVQWAAFLEATEDNGFQFTEVGRSAIGATFNGEFIPGERISVFELCTGELFGLAIA